MLRNKATVNDLFLEKDKVILRYGDNNELHKTKPNELQPEPKTAKNIQILLNKQPRNAKRIRLKQWRRSADSPSPLNISKWIRTNPRTMPINANRLKQQSQEHLRFR